MVKLVEPTPLTASAAKLKEKCKDKIPLGVLIGYSIPVCEERISTQYWGFGEQESTKYLVLDNWPYHMATRFIEILKSHSGEAKTKIPMINQNGAVKFSIPYPLAADVECLVKRMFEMKLPESPPSPRFCI